MPEDHELTASMMGYLAKVYRLYGRLSPNEDYVPTSDLAELLEVSAPAVNRMVTRLKELGFLEHERYKGVRLTEQGVLAALLQLRRQRIAESFLVSVMGFGWHQVHDEAERIAAASSEAMVERMAHMAGNPTRCPHGEPIPAADGTLPKLTDEALTQAALERDYRITRVRTWEADRLEYMAALGLLPGKEIHLLHKAPFDGPIQLKLGHEYRIIGHNLAEVIYVEPVN